MSEAKVLALLAPQQPDEPTERYSLVECAGNLFWRNEAEPAFPWMGECGYEFSWADLLRSGHPITVKYIPGGES